MKTGIVKADTYKKFKDFIVPEVYSGINGDSPYLFYTNDVSRGRLR